MLQKNMDYLKKVLNDKMIDFYLEDDMFEIEGKAKVEGDKIIVKVLDAVGHVLEMAGDYLELQVKNKRLYAQRTDNGKVFEMEINRIYDRLDDPTPADFIKMNKAGIDQFFKKNTDTLVWMDEKTGKWFIELNKINMFFSGDRSSYDTIGQLYEVNKEQMGDTWQAVYFSSEVEEGN